MACKPQAVEKDLWSENSLLQNRNKEKDGGLLWQAETH